MPEDRIAPIERGVDVIHLLCAAPIDHALTYRRLGQITTRLRRIAPRCERILHLRSSLETDQPFAALPVDRVVRLPAHDPAAIVETVETRIAGEWRDARWLLLTRPEKDPLAARLGALLGKKLEASIPLAFAPIPPPSPELAAAELAFQNVLARAPVRWTRAPDVPDVLERVGEPEHVLVHQARFHIGDALWLSPLLVAVKRLWPRVRTVVAAPPESTPVLAEHPAVDELVPCAEETDPGMRQAVLERLAKIPLDVTLFAFARRPESRWLLDAMATRGVPRRLDLEYFDPDLDPAARLPSATHEGWCWWNAKPSPALLLELLAPLGANPTEWDDLRPVPPPLPEADAALASHGISAPYAVLAPGGRSSTRWEPARFAELAARLARRHSLKVLIEGSPAERSLLDDVARGARDRGAPADAIAVGCEPLPVLAALLARARLLVANDSAPIHLAAATATPTLYLAQQEKLVHSRPANRRAWAIYDDVANDLAAISVDQVLGAVARMLSVTT